MSKKRIRKKAQMHEIEILYKRPTLESMHRINSSSDAVDRIREIISMDRISYREVFIVLYLTNGNRLLGYTELGRGSSTGVAVETRDIIVHALKTHSKAIIVAHNHPSGNLQPSEADRNFTAQIKRASSWLNISLLDSMIVTQESYYSFSDEGDLLNSNNTLPF